VAEKPDPAKETLKIANIEIKVDPVLEWKQIFREAWRYSDYFYVKMFMGWIWIGHLKHILLG
jgi:tricorn protease